MKLKVMERLLAWAFSRMYAGYDYPFVKSDELIEAMLPHERRAYWESAKRVASEQAFLQELQECVRSFYQDLAVKDNSPMQAAAMKGALMFMKAFQSRMTYLARLGSAPIESDVTDMK